MIVIVGAGPAGLSAAYHLRSDFVLLEREATPGGLCRSFELAGATFDLGGHAFFTRHAYVRHLVETLSSVGLYSQPRSAWVYVHGRYVRYPFQSHLYGLPEQVVTECLSGVYRAAGRRTDAPADSLQDWIERSFGDGIARHFLTPYNAKLWAFPLQEIVPDWVDSRVVLPDLKAIVEGAVTDRAYTDFVNATVSYPAQGGFFGLYEGMAASVSDRLRRGRVERVHLSQKYVEDDAGRRLPYDALISTMPLTDLVAAIEDDIPCCRAAAAVLRHNSLHLVNLVFDRPGLSSMQRVYTAEASIPFHKLVLNSNSSDSLRHRPRFGMQAEVSFSASKPVDRVGLEERVLASLSRMGLLPHGDQPVAASTVTIEYAYPVYTRGTSAAREHLLDCLERRGVFCAGRFGEWLYINSDEAVMRGRAQAERIDAHLGDSQPGLRSA